MANDDSTRPGFDLSPWLKQDPLSIFQAAWLWAGIPPTLPKSPENEARYGRELAAARGWYAQLDGAAKAGELPYEKPVPKKKVQTGRAVSGSSYLGTPSRPATYREDDDWPAAHVTLANLRAFAESIGQRPAFLFPGTMGAETKYRAPEQPSEAGSDTNDQREEWARGIRRVAWDAAAAIVKKGDKLTADGLGKQMLSSGNVELKEDEYRLKLTDCNLIEREMKAKPSTIAGWVTALKKLLKP